MESKIMQVFYGNDCLPYKDRERQVHYPIVGNAFLGASNTTKIRFYFDYIGDSNTTWVSVAKLPNGKQGSRVLPIASDEDGNYAELELSNWYTQAKGDVYIALQGYQGGVEYEYDSETELYEIHGTPTIQTTGSIKLAINYAPIGQVADYNDEFSTYQDILALLGDKADVDNVYNKTEVDTALSGKVDKLESTGTYAYTHNGSTQGQNIYTPYIVNNAIVQRDNNGEINVPATPSDDSKATSKIYVVNEISSGLATKQNTLVSGTNIKTINGQSILGSGDLPISGGGSAEWGAISGDIQDQADLQSELQDIREVAEGKNKTLVLSYSTFAPANDTQAQLLKKTDGTAFTNLADFNSYVSGLTFRNNNFNSQDSSFSYSNFYLISSDSVVYRNDYLATNFKIGDIILITETDVPDRWVSSIGAQNVDYPLGFSKLETTKVDLSGYATTGDLSMARYETELMLAPEYNQFTSYAVGDKVVYAHKLYTCTTAIDTPESWDSTHWTQVSVASGFVDLDKAQVITGEKTIIGSKKLALKYSDSSTTTQTFYMGADSNFILSLYRGADVVYTFSSGAAFKFNTPIAPTSNGGHDLGTPTLYWKDLYLSGEALVHTIKFDTSTGNGIVGNANSDINFIIGASVYYRITNQMFRPMNDNVRDLGQGTLRWRDAYIGRNISDGTNSATVSQITNGILNVINVSDISVSGTTYTLSQEQFDLIGNGKPTLIKGTIAMSSSITLSNLVIISTELLSSNLNCICIAASGYNCYVKQILINVSTKQINFVPSSVPISINYQKPLGLAIGNKDLPAYPSNTGTFVLKCVDGVLTWVAE